MIEAARLHIATMILIEVVELIVHIDWPWNVLSDFEWNCANRVLEITLCLIIVVLNNHLLYLITHYVEQYPEAQENNTEDSKCDHG